MESIDKEELQSVSQIIQETLLKLKKEKKKELLLSAPDCCEPVCYRTANIGGITNETKRTLGDGCVNFCTVHVRSKQN